MSDQYLKTLITQIRSGNVAARNRFADLFGSIFLARLREEKKVLDPSAEQLAIKCVHNAIDKVIEAATDEDLETIINQVLDQTFAIWFRAFQIDVNEASHLQSALFPRPAPANAGLEIAARSRPLSPINGDLYDFIIRPEDTLIVLVDASGKGTAAGLFAAIAGGFFRGHAAGMEPPKQLLKRLNDAVTGASTGDKYLTAMLLSWRPVFQEICLASAGFSAPLVSKNFTRQTMDLQGSSLIGLDLPTNPAVEEYSEVRLSLLASDWVAVFSDGITDQTDRANQEYGVDRVWHIIQSNAEKSAEFITQQVFADLDRHAGGKPQQDDQTFVFLRVIDSN